MVSIEKRVTSGTSVTTAEEYVELLGFDEVLAIGAYYRRTERSPVGLAAYMTEADRGRYVFLRYPDGSLTGRLTFSQEVGSC